MPGLGQLDAQSPDATTGDAAVTTIEASSTPEELVFQQMEPSTPPLAGFPVLSLTLPSSDLAAPSGSTAPAAVIGDPNCRAFFVRNPPNLESLPPIVRPLVGGTVQFPDCTGSLMAKLTTKRTGKVCVQMLEPGRGGSYKSLKCTEQIFPTRSVGTYNLTAVANCRPGRNRYRMTDRLTIQRGPLVDTGAAHTPGKFFTC